MKLYAGNLPFNLTQQDIETAFAEFGDVASVNLVIDKDTNRSKGFAFIEMTESAAAKDALHALDGSPLNGRTIKVSIAKAQGENKPSHPPRPPHRNKKPRRVIAR